MRDLAGWPRLRAWRETLVLAAEELEALAVERVGGTAVLQDLVSKFEEERAEQTPRPERIASLMETVFDQLMPSASPQTVRIVSEFADQMFAASEDAKFWHLVDEASQSAREVLASVARSSSARVVSELPYVSPLDHPAIVIIRGIEGQAGYGIEPSAEVLEALIAEWRHLARSPSRSGLSELLYRMLDEFNFRDIETRRQLVAEANSQAMLAEANTILGKAAAVADESSRYRDHAEQSSKYAAEASGQTATSSLAHEYARRARVQSRAAHCWTGSSIVTLSLAVIAGARLAAETNEMSGASVLRKLALGLPLLGLEGYLARLGSHHRALGADADEVALQLRTIRSYVTDLDPGASNEILRSFGLAVFTGNRRPKDESLGLERPVVDDVVDLLKSATAAAQAARGGSQQPR